MSPRVTIALGLAAIAAVVVAIIMVVWEAVSGVPTSDKIYWRITATSVPIIITAPIALSWWWHVLVWAGYAFSLGWLFSSEERMSDEVLLLPHFVFVASCFALLLGLGGLLWGMAGGALLFVFRGLHCKMVDWLVDACEAIIDPNPLDPFGLSDPFDVWSFSFEPEVLSAVIGVGAVIGVCMTLSFLFGPIIGLPAAALTTAYVVGSKAFRK